MTLKSISKILLARLLSRRTKSTSKSAKNHKKGHIKEHFGGSHKRRQLDQEPVSLEASQTQVWVVVEAPKRAAKEEDEIYPKPRNAGNPRLWVREHGSTTVMLEKARRKSRVTTVSRDLVQDYPRDTNKLIEERSKDAPKTSCETSPPDGASDPLDSLEGIKPQFWDSKKEMVLTRLKKNVDKE
ncbi:hypothetical protein TWF679_000576 [Orbilia oligospora]|uniref:Uncharacterized protein n=1 Tax=Orbilia oligospora TaxID=2813651 RepID=A0A8H8UXJ8_ORBOL|nr:hypothetical protein TWF679_000576 [Orbilia oligospora]